MKSIPRILVSVIILIIACYNVNGLAKNQAQNPYKIIALTAASATNGGPQGSAKLLTTGLQPQQLAFTATGLKAGATYKLLLNDQLILQPVADNHGTIDLTLTLSAANASTTITSTTTTTATTSTTTTTKATNALTASVEAISADATLLASINPRVELRTAKDVTVLRGMGLIADSGVATTSATEALNVSNVLVEVNQVVTLPIFASDGNGDPLTLSVTCDRGNFVSLQDRNLRVAPKQDDLGDTNCTLKATDSFDLTTEFNFLVQVIPANRPPVITPIADQTVTVGEFKRFAILASDPENERLQASLISTVPAIRGIFENDGRSFTVELAPRTEMDGGRVTVQVRDASGQTSQATFNVVVQRALMITNVRRLKPTLIIDGNGFTGGGAQVMINNTDVSRFVTMQTNTAITLRGSNKKLNIRSGANQATVIVGNTVSNGFIFMP
jgi:hypothetical protein